MIDAKLKCRRRTYAVDPSASYDEAIRLASEYGSYKVVKLLDNKLVDPSVYYNYPIRLASKNGYSEVVKLLLTDKRG